jgi:hypothetical protein
MELEGEPLTPWNLNFATDVSSLARHTRSALGPLDHGSSKSRVLLEFFDFYLLKVGYAGSDKLKAYSSTAAGVFFNE